MLKELDGLCLAGTFASNRLKKFHSCQQLYLNYTSDFNQEMVPTLEDFLIGNDNNLSRYLMIFLIKMYLFSIFYICCVVLFKISFLGTKKLHLNERDCI